MKNKQIQHVSNIMSKCHVIFTKNFTFLLSNIVKTGKVPKLSQIFEDHLLKTMYMKYLYCKNKSFHFKQFYIFYQ